VLQPGTYGMALVSQSFGLDFIDSLAGSYTDPDLSIQMGSTTDAPFTGRATSPRTLCGVIAYTRCDGSTVHSGVGCMDGTGVGLAIRGLGCPDRGSSYIVALSGGIHGTGPAFLAMGLSDQAPYPIDLAPLGAPGCWLYVSQEVLLPMSTSASGPSLQLSLPTDPALVGALVHWQGFMVDPQANSLGIISSDYLSVTVG
jgi:hypothetical protein